MFLYSVYKINRNGLITFITLCEAGLRFFNKIFLTLMVVTQNVETIKVHYLLRVTLALSFSHYKSVNWEVKDTK